MAEQTGAAKAARITTPRIGTVAVHVAGDVKLETLTETLAHIGRLTGCPTCGLVGVDVLFRGDPAELAGIRSLPGINSVGFEG